PEVLLLVELAARELYLGRIDDDDAVTAVQVGCERGLVLAAQDLGDAAREPAERLVSRVDDEPTVRHVLFSQTERLHSRPSQGSGLPTAANYTRGVRACQPDSSGLARVPSGGPF